MNTPLDFMEKDLALREKNACRRSLRTVEFFDRGRIHVGNRILVNFSGNDYLGLSKDPLLIHRATVFAARFGAGATASRLICGNLPCMEEVEKKIAHLKGTEAALVLASGFQANISLIAALCDRDTLLYSDALNHHSIIQGSKLSGASIHRFRHNDFDHLEELLEKAPGGYRKCIVTESVFSMDGDIPDIERLSALAKDFKALLIVDEAHATGVFGENGMGFFRGDMAHAIMGTFSKGGGSFGAYVAGSSLLRDYLVNFMGGFIFSTALPPMVLGMMDAALDRIPEMEQERKHLLDLAGFLRSGLKKLGLNPMNSASQIVPIRIGKAEEALALSKHLEEKGFFALAIRPPTVGPGESRIRISLSALHRKEDVEAFLDALGDF